MYHIEITKDGKTIESADIEGMPAVFSKVGEEGVHAETMFECKAKTIFEMLVSLDKICDNILSTDPALQFLYNNRDMIIRETTAIDVTALRKAGMGQNG